MTSAIIFGSTGAVGKNLKACLLKSAEISHVTEAARSVQSTNTQDKLTQIKLDDNAELKADYDLVFITLGTTAKKAGSSQKFEEIDRHLVIDMAKKVAKKDAHVIYCSAAGANAKSPFLYPRSKGLTEQGLAELGYSTTTIFRPGFLAQAERNESRPAETVFGYVTGFLSKFSSGLEIPVHKLGQSMVVAGLKQLKGETVGEASNGMTIVSNKAALELSHYIQNPPKFTKKLAALDSLTQPNCKYIRNDTSNIQAVDKTDDNTYMYLFEDKAELNDLEYDESHAMILRKVLKKKFEPVQVAGYQIKETDLKLEHELTSLFPIVDEDIDLTPDTALQGYEHMERILT
ncbi:hypothetical protein E3P99_01089 [Wallemia hederae]|uniref:NAD(P)-binding domain-containing protein n=1 Tax=Wallemia hederae TaxID=1540922 RepID=A0A4T0FRZ4_9BASI|nr:hypothetical protein E3P99_01089 [Wallemia hederae]